MNTHAIGQQSNDVITYHEPSRKLYCTFVKV